MVALDDDFTLNGLASWASRHIVIKTLGGLRKFLQRQCHGYLHATLNTGLSLLWM